MGIKRGLEIAAFEKAAGIEKATEEAGDALHMLSQHAYELIRIVELERSGIRDGDGYWGGSDPLGGTVLNISDRWQMYRRLTEPSDDGDIPV